MRLGVAFSVTTPPTPTVDEDLVIIGTIGTRPTAASGYQGRQYYATDTGLVYVCVPDGGGYQWLTVGPSAATSWRTTPDAHDLGVWTMDEASGSFANSGADGSLDLAPAGTIVYRDAGPLGTGIYLDGHPGTYAASAATTKCQPTTGLTVWGWVRVREEVAGGPLVLAKFHDQTDPGSWNAPYFDFALWAYASGNNGRWLAGVNVGGTLVTIDNGYARGRLIVGREHLLALTHDKTTLRAYLDGAPVGSAPAVGDIAWNGGPIVRGGNPFASAGGVHRLDGWLGEARVRDEVLTRAQISEIYRSHLGVYP